MNDQTRPRSVFNALPRPLWSSPGEQNQAFIIHPGGADLNTLPRLLSSIPKKQTPILYHAFTTHAVGVDHILRGRLNQICWNSGSCCGWSSDGCGPCALVHSQGLSLPSSLPVSINQPTILPYLSSKSRADLNAPLRPLSSIPKEQISMFYHACIIRLGGAELNALFMFLLSITGE